jgi:hypothetical protein
MPGGIMLEQLVARVFQAQNVIIGTIDDIVELHQGRCTIPTIDDLTAIYLHTNYKLTHLA